MFCCSSGGSIRHPTPSSVTLTTWNKLKTCEGKKKWAGVIFRAIQKWRQLLAVLRGNTVTRVKQFPRVVFTCPGYSSFETLDTSIVPFTAPTIRRATTSSRNPARVIRPHSSRNWSGQFSKTVLSRQCMLCTAERHMKFVQHVVCQTA